MTIYDIVFFVFSIAYLPYLAIKGKAHEDFGQRFGYLSPVLKEAGKARPVWIHAVSVGEVFAVKKFIRDFSKRFPGRKIVISTTTQTGNSIAKKILDKGIPKFYFPLDFTFTVRRALDIINPSALLIMETEIWPNLVLELFRRKVPVALINGRISDNSFGGYKKIKFFFGKVLKKMNLFCMQTEKDRERIEVLGAPGERVKVTGSMKSDVEELAPSEMDLGIDSHEELIIAGSTHAGEEEIVLGAYKKLAVKFKSVRLLIAPRHIDRVEAIKKMVEREGFEAVLVSDLRNGKGAPLSKKSVLILDTLGELARLFSRAAIIFMGGSFVKKGGHNIVEPAVFGKPIVFGPDMSNFRDIAKLFLEENAAIKVSNKEMLSSALENLLEDVDKRISLGRRARSLIDRNRGATERIINEVAELL